MLERPEDRDIADFIVASGGMGKAALRILARDRREAALLGSLSGFAAPTAPEPARRASHAATR